MKTQNKQHFLHILPPEVSAPEAETSGAEQWNQHLNARNCSSSNGPSRLVPNVKRLVSSLKTGCLQLGTRIKMAYCEVQMVPQVCALVLVNSIIIMYVLFFLISRCLCPVCGCNLLTEITSYPHSEKWSGPGYNANDKASKMSLWLARSVLYMLTITKKNRMIVEHTMYFSCFTWKC